MSLCRTRVRQARSHARTYTHMRTQTTHTHTHLILSDALGALMELVIDACRLCLLLPPQLYVHVCQFMQDVSTLVDACRLCLLLPPQLYR